MSGSFLKTHKTSIVDSHGRPVALKGVNFGGWLMMEAYFLYAVNWPQQKFEKEFIEKRSTKTLEDLLRNN